MNTRRGRRWLRSCGSVALFLCAAVAVPAARDFQTIEVDSLKVTIDSEWAPRAAPGYLPVRFDITNSGDARVIDIIGSGIRSFRTPRFGSSPTSVHQVVRLAKGDHIRITIPVPIFGDSENFRFEIHEGDRTLQRFNYSGLQSRLAAADASVLLVTTPGSDFQTLGARLLRTPGPRHASAVVASSIVDFQLDPERLPNNWLGFTSLRAVAIRTREWEQLTDGQKGALLTWTACGGDLILVDGDIKTLLPSAQTGKASDPERVVARHFFGRIHALTSAAFEAAGLENLLSATEQNHEVFWALPANTAPDFGAIEGRGFRLRIPGIAGVPARTYVAILILFSVLIGPVNYWLLWRKKQQVLLVLTAPLVSAAFIVLLTGYAVAGDGFRVQGRVITFTMLDQAAKQAVTRATASLYAAGLTPSGGLRFARDIAVFPIGPDGSGTRDRLDMDLTDLQRFAGGVLQARSPTNIEEIAVRPARERLTFSRTPGGMTVTNGLESSIALLLYRDGDTMFRLDALLAPGDKQTMTSSPVNAQPPIPPHVSIAPKFLSLFQTQPAGSYLAVLDHSPFWEPGIAGMTERGSQHIVLGWPEGQR